MHINELNFYQNTFEEHRENDEVNFESDFPLFNISALRESQVDFSDFNFYTSEKISEMVEEITTKKSRRNNGTELVIKQRGRKAVPKNGKLWNDPSITMKEIIENDLAGEPTVNDLRSKEERLRKMREGKALKRAQRLQGQNSEENTTIQETKNLKAMELAVANVEQTNVPQIVFKDGKIVVEMGNQNQEKKLTLVEANTKPKKLNSMSFRTKNHASKWTEEETRKFYKAIEIFGADFSMIAKLFPTRNRDQVKNKFNKESKTNGKMIDEAFKKNAALCKRSIMDRIKSFNTNLTALRDEGNENFELGMVSLERNGSNTSTDSMDLRVLEEIQEVFVKEMKEVKAKSNGFNLLNGSTFNFNNTQTNTENNSETNEVEAIETVDNNANNNTVHVENTAGNQQENLLFRLFK